PDSISVRRSDLERAEILLGSMPGFPGGGSGFSLFDDPKLSESDFDEQVNYQRAIQGELERAIMNIRGIQGAKVMLAMDDAPPFAFSRPGFARASVLLATSPGASIDGAIARSIAMLVAGSVRGLSPERVTVTGNDGVILYPPPPQGDMADQLYARSEIERRLTLKARELLERIMGQGRYAVQVAVELDSTKVSVKDNAYKPGPITAEEHSLQPIPQPPSGILGPTSNLPSPIPQPTPTDTRGATPNATPTPSVVEKFIEKRIVDYKPSETETTTFQGALKIKRISVAAVVDGTYDGGAFAPLSGDRLDEIRNLLAAAVGVDLERGDRIDVESVALSRPYQPPPQIDPLREFKELMSNPRYLYGGATVGFVLFAGVGWLFFRTIKRSINNRRLRKMAERIAVRETSGGAAESSSVVKDVPGEVQSFVDLKHALNREVEADIENAAEIIRTWVNDASNGGTATAIKQT